MKQFYRAVMLLILPLSLHAQDTTAVKQQATAMATALLNGDYKSVVDRCYPKLVDLAGGKEKMVFALDSAMADLKKLGISIESAAIGSPGKFYKAGSEIHCLVPETIRSKLPNGHAISRSNLLAISSDGGKNWTFVDLNQGTIGGIHDLFPNFNPELKIPDPTPPAREP